MTNTTAICGYQGRVGSAQADATGALSLDGAAAIVADALQACAGEPARQAATSMALHRADAAAAPRLGEVVRCTVEPPTAADATRWVARITGPRGTAWEAELQLPADTAPVAATVDGAVALPPLQLMRPMHAADCDQAGHVNVRVFMELADEATQALLASLPGQQGHLGHHDHQGHLGHQGHPAGEAAPLQIDQVRISFRRELFRGDVVSVHSGIRQVDAAGAAVVHGLVHQATGAVACIVETRLAPHPKTSAGATADAVAAALDSLRPLQADWPSLPPARAPGQPRAGAAPADGAVATAMAVVDAWDCDPSARLTLRALVNLCSTGARQYLATIGLTGERFHREQITVAAVDYLIDIGQRPPLGSNLTMRTAFLSGSAKSIRFVHHLLDSDHGTVYATVEIVGVMLDLAAHRSMEIPADVRQRLGMR